MSADRRSFLKGVLGAGAAAGVTSLSPAEFRRTTIRVPSSSSTNSSHAEPSMSLRISATSLNVRGTLDSHSFIIWHQKLNDFL